MIRERLVEVATNRFLSQGYHGTGVAEIQSEAGIASGGLYHHFSTKEELLLAVLDRYESFLRSRILERSFCHTGDPIERIFEVFDFYTDFLSATGCYQGSLLGNLALELSDTHPRVRRRLEELFDGLREAIRGCVREAGDRFPSEDDPEAIATFVVAVLEGAVMQCRVGKRIDPLLQSVRQLRGYFLRLVDQEGGVELPAAPAVESGDGRMLRTA